MAHLPALLHDGVLATGAAVLLYSGTVTTTALVAVLAPARPADAPPAKSCARYYAAHMTQALIAIEQLGVASTSPEAAVHLAATLVQCLTTGVLRRKL
jgi:hypothetical protein